MDITQAPLSETESVLIGLAVAVVLLPSPTWRLVQHFQVMAHEGMHGAVGSLSGGRVEWIELTRQAEGATIVRPASSAGFLAAGFAGYLGPSAFGLGAARLIQFGHIIAVLWIAVGLLGVLLVMLRPSFGYVTVPLAGLVIFLVLRYASPATQTLASYSITWFLLLSGVRIVVQRGVNAADAGILAGRTNIPRLVWFGLWLAGTAAAVVIGARWMLHPAAVTPG